MLLHRTHVWTSLLVGFIISLPITVFCEANTCNPDSEFQCRDSPNVCIPLARIQDGVRDCPDGSDEECLATQFDCVTGSPKCLEASRVNDGRVDCQNGRDEGCPEAYFVCADRSACIPPTHVGDGKLHCHDGSDEGSCGEDHFQCRSGECIPKLWFQDGLKDCPDGSDEECLPHQHRCLCGKPRCLDPERVGDGVLDCLEGSDEVEIDENNFNCPLVEENEMTQIKRSKRQLGPEIPMEFGGPMPVFIFTPVMEPTGLLSSTVDTMVLGGITTLFATELYGTYDPNGQYLQFVKTRARVLPKSDPVSFLTPTESFNSDDVLHTAEHAFDVQPRLNDDFSSSQEPQIVEAFNGEDGLLDFTTSSLMESSTTSRMEVFPTVFVSGKRITSEVQKDVAQNKVQTRSSDPYRVEKLPKASDHVYPAYVLTYTVGQKRKMSTTKTMGPPEALTLTSSQQTSQVNPTDTSTITKLTKNTASTNKPMVRHKTLTIGNNPQLRSRISLQPPSPPSVSGTPTPTGRSLNLIQTETTKKNLSKRTRITIKGFVHFTTTVSGTEIIFMPQTTAEQREDKVTIGSTQTVMPTSTVTSSSKTDSLSKPSDAVLISENMDEITIGSHKDASVMSSKASIENTPVLSSSMEEMSSSITVGTKELISPTLKMIESPSQSSQSTLSVSDSDNTKLPESSTSIIVDKQMELSNTIASDILTPDIFSSMNVDKSIELSNSIPLDILSPIISSSIIVDKQMELSDSLNSETSSVDMSSSTLDKQVEVSVISSSIIDKQINSDLSSPGIKDLPSASIMISETLVTVEASPTITETTQTTILDFNSFEIILPNREKTNSTDLEKMTESVDSATSPFSDMFDIADLEATPTPPSNETWDDEELPLGLISSTEGTSVNDGTTTHFTTIVIGTMIDGNYAQIIQSTSSLLFTISGDASTSSTSDIAPSKTSFTTLTHYKTVMQGDFPFVTSDLEIISQVVPETPSVNTLPLSSSINEDATTFSQFSTIVQGDFTLGTSASEVISNDFTDKEHSIESKIQGSSIVESGTTTFEHFTIITDGLFPFITSGVDIIKDESTAIASSIIEKENSETTMTQFSTITSGEFSFVTSKLDIITESPLLDYAQNTLSSLFTHYSTIFRGNSFSVISEVVTNTMKETITSTVGQDNSESRTTDELDSSIKSQGRSINSDPKSQLFSYQTIRRNEPQSLLKEPIDTSSTTILIPLDIDSTVFTQFSTISDGSFPIPISSEEIIKNTMTKLPNDDIQSSETRFTQFSTTIQGDFPVVISSEEIVSEKKETTISESNSSVNAENIESVFTQFTTLAEGDFVIATSKIEDINSVQIDSTSTVATVSSNNNNDVIKDSLTSFTDFTTVSQENFPLATSIVEVLGDNSTNSVEITDTSKFLKTSFTTFTHFTTSFQGEFPFVTSNLEIVSNIVSEKIDESEIITEITRTDFFFTRPSEVRQNSSTDFSTLSNTSATESTTYLTFTHFTTFLVGNETSIDGREVTVTNIVPIESSESINNMSPQVLPSISPTSVVLDSSVKISSIMSVINQPSMEDRADRIAEIPTDGAEASGLEIQIEKPDGFVDARADSLDSFETVTTTQTYYTTFFLDGSTSLVSREVIATSIVEKTPLIPVSPKEENLISSLELQTIPELATSSQLFNTFTYYTTFIVSGATSISSSVIVIPVDPSFSSSAIIATPTLFAEITPVVGSHASNIIVIPFPNSHEIENGNTNTVLQANSEQYTVPTSMFINAVTQLNNNNNSSLEHEQEIDKSINEVGTMINMEMPSSTPQPDNTLNNYTNNFNYSSATLGESQDKSLESSMFGSTLDNTNPTSKLFSLLKTLYTTYTYYTTFISNGTSSTTTRKQTVSNIITDPILTPIPAAPVKTYYTTYTYYTTFIKDGNTSVTSRKVTESNVISDAIQITSTPHPEISPTYPVTQYTTFTYFTTSYQDGSTILKSNEEVKSTIYTNHEQFLNAKTDLTTPDLKSSNSLEPSSSAATIYTTFTYYTTSYNGDQTFVTSRLETTSSVVSDSLSPFLSSLTEITFTPSDSPAWMFLSPTSTLESVSSSSSSPSEAFVTVVDPFSDLIATSSSQSIGLLSSITSTNIRDGLTTAYTTAVYGTILDGIYTSIYHSSSSVFVGPQTSSDNDIITVSPIQSNEPQLAVISPTSATTSSYPTGLVSSTTGSIVNDGTITLFTSRVIGTYIDGTYGQIIESTSRIVLGQATASNVQEKVEPTATPTPDFQDIYIIGLVSNIPGSTEVRDGLTTLHETQVIGTYIEGSYAQILSPTTRILSDKTILESTPSFVFSESVLSTSSLSTTSDTVLTTLQEPVATPTLESEVNTTTTTISSTTTETSTSSLKGPLRRPSLRPFNTRFRPFNRSKTSSTSGASSFRSRITSTRSSTSGTRFYGASSSRGSSTSGSRGSTSGFRGSTSGFRGSTTGGRGSVSRSSSFSRFSSQSRGGNSRSASRSGRISATQTSNSQSSRSKFVFTPRNTRFRGLKSSSTQIASTQESSLFPSTPLDNSLTESSIDLNPTPPLSTEDIERLTLSEEETADPQEEETVSSSQTQEAVSSVKSFRRLRPRPRVSSRSAVTITRNLFGTKKNEATPVKTARKSETVFDETVEDETEENDKDDDEERAENSSNRRQVVIRPFRPGDRRPFPFANRNRKLFRKTSREDEGDQEESGSELHSVKEPAPAQVFEHAAFPDSEELISRKRRFADIYDTDNYDYETYDSQYYEQPLIYGMKEDAVRQYQRPYRSTESLEEEEVTRPVRPPRRKITIRGRPSTKPASRSQVSETKSRAQETKSRAQETKSRAQETKSRAQETKTRAQETKSRAQETTEAETIKPTRSASSRTRAASKEPRSQRRSSSSNARSSSSTKVRNSASRSLTQSTREKTTIRPSSTRRVITRSRPETSRRVVATRRRISTSRSTIKRTNDQRTNTRRSRYSTSFKPLPTIITVTHTLNTTKVVPIFHGRETEIRTLHTTTLSEQILHPNDYTAMERNGNTVTILSTTATTDNITPTLTYVTEVLITSSLKPTTTITRLRGGVRDTRTSTLLVYGLSTVVNTNTPQLEPSQPANPLASLFLSQLLLNQFFPNQQQVTVSTSTYSYVVTTTITQSSIIPLVFRDKTKYSTLTERKVLPSTITTTTTVPVTVNPSFPPINPLFPLFNPLQYQLLNQQFNPQLNPQLPTTEPISKERFREPETEEEQDQVPPPRKPKPEKTGPITSVLTLFLSGEKPGQFNSFITTVTLDNHDSVEEEEATRAKRAAGIDPHPTEILLQMTSSPSGYDILGDDEGLHQDLRNDVELFLMSTLTDADEFNPAKGYLATESLDSMQYSSTERQESIIESSRPQDPTSDSIEESYEVSEEKSIERVKRSPQADYEDDLAVLVPSFDKTVRPKTRYFTYTRFLTTIQSGRAVVIPTLETVTRVATNNYRYDELTRTKGGGFHTRVHEDESDSFDEDDEENVSERKTAKTATQRITKRRRLQTSPTGRAIDRTTKSENVPSSVKSLKKETIRQGFTRTRFLQPSKIIESEPVTEDESESLTTLEDIESSTDSVASPEIEDATEEMEKLNEDAVTTPENVPKPRKQKSRVKVIRIRSKTVATNSDLKSDSNEESVIKSSVTRKVVLTSRRVKTQKTALKSGELLNSLDQQESASRARILPTRPISLTYFTTFTYLSTLIVNDETQISSREAVTSHVSKETVNSALANIIQKSEGYSELPEDATPTNFGTRVRNGKTTVVYVGSRIRVHDGGSLSASRPVIKITRTRQRSSATDEVSATKSVVPSKIDHSPRTFMTIYTYFYTFVEDLATRFSSSEATYTEVSTDRATPLPDLMEKHENSAGVYTITSDSKLANLGSHILGDITTFINLGSKTLVMLGDHDLPPTSTKSLSDDSSGVTESSPISVAPPTKTRTSGRTKFRTRTRTSTSKSTELEPSYLESSTQFDIDSSTLIPTPVQEEETELITEQDDTSLKDMDTLSDEISAPISSNVLDTEASSSSSSSSSSLVAASSSFSYSSGRSSLLPNRSLKSRFSFSRVRGDGRSSRPISSSTSRTYFTSTRSHKFLTRSQTHTGPLPSNMIYVTYTTTTLVPFLGGTSYRTLHVVTSSLSKLDEADVTEVVSSEAPEASPVISSDLTSSQIPESSSSLVQESPVVTDISSSGGSSADSSISSSSDLSSTSTFTPSSVTRTVLETVTSTLTYIVTRSDGSTPVISTREETSIDVLTKTLLEPLPSSSLVPMARDVVSRPVLNISDSNTSQAGGQSNTLELVSSLASLQVDQKLELQTKVMPEGVTLIIAGSRNASAPVESPILISPIPQTLLPSTLIGGIGLGSLSSLTSSDKVSMSDNQVNILPEQPTILDSKINASPTQAAETFYTTYTYLNMFKAGSSVITITSKSIATNIVMLQSSLSTSDFETKFDTKTYLTTNTFYSTSYDGINEVVHSSEEIVTQIAITEAPNLVAETSKILPSTTFQQTQPLPINSLSKEPALPQINPSLESHIVTKTYFTTFTYFTTYLEGSDTLTTSRTNVVTNVVQQIVQKTRPSLPITTSPIIFVKPPVTSSEVPFKLSPGPSSVLQALPEPASSDPQPANVDTLKSDSLMPTAFATKTYFTTYTYFTTFFDGTGTSVSTNKETVSRIITEAIVPSMINSNIPITSMMSSFQPSTVTQSNLNIGLTTPTLDFKQASVTVISDNSKSPMIFAPQLTSSGLPAPSSSSSSSSLASQQSLPTISAISFLPSLGASSQQLNDLIGATIISTPTLISTTVLTAPTTLLLIDGQTTKIEPSNTLYVVVDANKQTMTLTGPEITSLLTMKADPVRNPSRPASQIPVSLSSKITPSTTKSTTPSTISNAAPAVNIGPSGGSFLAGVAPILGGLAAALLSGGGMVGISMRNDTDKNSLNGPPPLPGRPPSGAIVPGRNEPMIIPLQGPPHLHPPHNAPPPPNGPQIIFQQNLGGPILPPPPPPPQMIPMNVPPPPALFTNNRIELGTIGSGNAISNNQLPLAPIYTGSFRPGATEKGFTPIQTKQDGSPPITTVTSVLQGQSTIFITRPRNGIKPSVSTFTLQGSGSEDSYITAEGLIQSVIDGTTMVLALEPDHHRDRVGFSTVDYPMDPIAEGAENVEHVLALATIQPTVSTYYTTYTYFTTLFDKSTTTVTSREETVSQVKTVYPDGRTIVPSSIVLAPATVSTPAHAPSVIHLEPSQQDHIGSSFQQTAHLGEGLSNDRSIIHMGMQHSGEKNRIIPNHRPTNPEQHFPHHPELRPPPMHEDSDMIIHNLPPPRPPQPDHFPSLPRPNHHEQLPHLHQPSQPEHIPLPPRQPPQPEHIPHPVNQPEHFLPQPPHHPSEPERIPLPPNHERVNLVPSPNQPDPIFIQMEPGSPPIQEGFIPNPQPQNPTHHQHLGINIGNEKLDINEPQFLVPSFRPNEEATLLFIPQTETRFITYTYYTTIFDAGRRMVSSREETLSTLFAATPVQGINAGPTVINIPPRRPIEFAPEVQNNGQIFLIAEQPIGGSHHEQERLPLGIQHTNTIITDKADVSQIEIERPSKVEVQTRIPGLSSRLLTFTYYTTMLHENGQRIVTSREETLTQVFTPSTEAQITHSTSKVTVNDEQTVIRVDGSLPDNILSNLLSASGATIIPITSAPPVPSRTVIHIQATPTVQSSVISIRKEESVRVVSSPVSLQASPNAMVSTRFITFTSYTTFFKDGTKTVSTSELVVPTLITVQVTDRKDVISSSTIIASISPTQAISPTPTVSPSPSSSFIPEVLSSVQIESSSLIVSSVLSPTPTILTLGTLISSSIGTDGIVMDKPHMRTYFTTYTYYTTFLKDGSIPVVSTKMETLSRSEVITPTQSIQVSSPIVTESIKIESPSQPSINVASASTVYRTRTLLFTSFFGPGSSSVSASEQIYSIIVPIAPTRVVLYQDGSFHTRPAAGGGAVHSLPGQIVSSVIFGGRTVLYLANGAFTTSIDASQLQTTLVNGQKTFFVRPTPTSQVGVTTAPTIGGSNNNGISLAPTLGGSINSGSTLPATTVRGSVSNAEGGKGGIVAIGGNKPAEIGSSTDENKTTFIGAGSTIVSGATTIFGEMFTRPVEIGGGPKVQYSNAERIESISGIITRYITRVDSSSRTIVSTKPTMIGLTSTNVVNTNVYPPRTMVITVVGDKSTNIRYVNGEQQPLDPSELREIFGTTTIAQPPAIEITPTNDPASDPSVLVQAGFGGNGRATTTPTTTTKSSKTASIQALDSKCKPGCNIAGYEICKEISVDKGRCECRDGYARNTKTKKCELVRTYLVQVALMKKDKQNLVYKDIYRNTKSFEFRDIATGTNRGADQVFQASEAVERYYRGNKIINITAPEAPNKGIVANMAVHVSNNSAVDELMLRNELDKWARANNFTLGKTNLVTSGAGGSLKVTDFDECSHPDFNDCHQNANCINTPGSFICKCEGNFQDDDHVFPGRVCIDTTCDFCSRHGSCVMSEYGHRVCKCHNWYLGKNCQVNGYALAIILPIIAGLLLLAAIIWLCCCCHKRNGCCGCCEKRHTPTAAAVATTGVFPILGGGVGAGTLDKKAMIAGDTSSESSGEQSRLAHIADVFGGAGTHKSRKSGQSYEDRSMSGFVTEAPVLIPRAKHQHPKQYVSASTENMMAASSADHADYAGAESKLISILEADARHERNMAIHKENSSFATLPGSGKGKMHSVGNRAATIERSDHQMNRSSAMASAASGRHSSQSASKMSVSSGMEKRSGMMSGSSAVSSAAAAGAAAAAAALGSVSRTEKSRGGKGESSYYSSQEASSSHHMESYGGGKMDGYGGSKMEGYGGSKMEGYGGSKMEGYGGSKMEGYGTSKLGAMDTQRSRSTVYRDAREQADIDTFSSRFETASTGRYGNTTTMSVARSFDETTIHPDTKRLGASSYYGSSKGRSSHFQENFRTDMDDGITDVSVSTMMIPNSQIYYEHDSDASDSTPSAIMPKVYTRHKGANNYDRKSYYSYDNKIEIDSTYPESHT